MKIDILQKIHSKEISIEEADKLYDEVMDSKDMSLESNLGLNKRELTAFAQGATLEDLAKFRYEGWPNICSKCNKRLDLDKHGWWLKEENAKWEIEHVEC